MSLILLRSMLPSAPTFLKNTASHLLSLNPHSQHWDFRTFITVSLLRSFLTGPEKHDSQGRVMTIEQTQAMANTDRGIDDNTWAAKVSMPVDGVVSEEEMVGLEELVDRAVRELGGIGVGGGEVRVDKAKVGRDGLTGEWVGWRDAKKRGSYRKVKKGGEEWSEQRKFEALKEDVGGFREKEAEEGVVLWLHGGGYFMGDPTTHRPMGKYTSKEFGGPVFIPRYRLAPQHPFPAALVDALVSYLYLLHPPSGSFHTPYTPSQIFVAGDSAGGGLALSFIQLLLWLQRPNDDGSKKNIQWMGKEIEFTVPKGLLIMSAWADAARCLPSEVSCAAGDYIPTPEQSLKSRYSQSEAWPADPPRTLLHVDDTAITHPLVSPVMAKSWEGCPSVWWCVGDECMRDSNLFVAQRLLASSVPLHFEKYTNMPHVFSMVLSRHPTSPYSFKSIGKFLKGHLVKTPYEYKRVRIHPKTLGVEELPEGEFSVDGMTMESLREMMEKVVGEWKPKVREKEGKTV